MRWLPLLFLCCLLLLAGCDDVRDVGVEPTVSVDGPDETPAGAEPSAGDGGDDGSASEQSVEVEPTDEGYRVTTTVTPAPEPAVTFRNLTVTGVGPDDRPVCTARFGDVRSGDGPTTETMRCDRLPMALHTDDDGLAETPSSGPDLVSDHPTLALLDVTASGSTYEYRYEPVPSTSPTGRARTSTASGYAKCVQRRDGVDPDAFAGPTPWLDWERVEPTVERNYGIATVNRTGRVISADPQDGPVFEESMQLPADPAVEPVRESLERARTVESTGGPDGVAFDEAGHGQTLSKDELVAVFDAIHDRRITSLEDVPATDVETFRGSPEDGGLPYAAGVRYDSRRIECTAGERGEYRGADRVEMTYAVEYRGDRFEVLAAGGTRWTGPAFDASVNRSRGNETAG
jgi:hypothetical protein